MIKIGYVKESSQKENVFKLHVPSPDSYVFTLIPIEGKASLYVNPAFLPKQNDQFYYSALQEVVKRIIVNDNDIKGMGLNKTVSCLKSRIFLQRFTVNTPAGTSSRWLKSRVASST